MRHEWWKRIVASGLCLALSGCSLFSGNYSNEPHIVDGKVATYETAWLKRTKPVLKKTRQTQAAALGDNLENSITALATTETKRLELAIEKEKNKTRFDECDYMTEAAYIGSKAEAQKVYREEVRQCKSDQKYTAVISMLGGIVEGLTQGKSDIASLADSLGLTIRSVANEGTQKLNAVTRFLSGGIIAIESRKAIESSHDSLRDVGVAAAETGNTSVGSIVVNGQSSVASSNDGGSGGEMGAGGAGSGTASITGDNTTNLTIGTRNSASVAADDAGAFAGTRSTQLLEPSGNGTVVEEDNNIDQLINVDSQNATNDNSPNIGNGNGFPSSDGAQ